MPWVYDQTAKAQSSLVLKHITNSACQLLMSPRDDLQVIVMINYRGFALKIGVFQVTHYDLGRSN